MFLIWKFREIKVSYGNIKRARGLIALFREVTFEETEVVKMDLRPYYFIYFLDCEFGPNDSDFFIPLYPAGYLVIGEGVWPEEGSHSTENAFFTLEAALEALRKMQEVLGSKPKPRSKLLEMGGLN